MKIPLNSGHTSTTQNPISRTFFQRDMKINPNNEHIHTARKCTLMDTFSFSLTHARWRKHYFGVKFQKLRFLWIYTIWYHLRRKIMLLAVCLCVCESICLFFFYQRNPSINNSRKCKFGIIWRCCLKLFVIIGQIVCAQKNTKGFHSNKSYGRNFL